MMVLLFIFAVMLALCSGQDYAGHGNISNCIRKYMDLEAHVLNDKELIGDLAEVFFKTGEPFTEFVKITYKFSVGRSKNDTTACYANDDSNSTCVKQFIWSSSAFYFLGPQPLLWQTLFAVRVHESSVTIHLPCLCDDVYEELLSRLTYLIKTYPAKQFQSETLEFISIYFFEAKGRDEDYYKNIVKLFTVTIFSPIAAFIVFAYLVFYHTEWIAKHVTRYIEKDTDTRNDKRTTETSQKDRQIKIVALAVSSMCLSMALFAFHIVASVKLIQYGNDVLDKDDQSLPIIYTVFSFLSIIYLLYILILKCREYNEDTTINEVLGKCFQLSFGGLLVYLGFYFLPYMILAFIVDPVVTAFVCFTEVIAILCICLLLHALCSVIVSLFKCSSSRLDKCKRNLSLQKFFVSYMKFYIVQASTISIAYLLAILIVILILGNLHDFLAVENLTIPVIIGLLSLFVLKPLFKYIKKSMGNEAAPNSTPYLDLEQDSPVSATVQNV